MVSRGLGKETSLKFLWLEGGSRVMIWHVLWMVKLSHKIRRSGIQDSLLAWRMWGRRERRRGMT